MNQRKRGAGAKKEVDLTAMVQTGEHGAYEALQLYRSRSLRFKSKSEFKEAMNVCYTGAVCILENGYGNAGAELASLYVELLTELSLPLTDETRDEIFQIDSKFPANALSQRTEFLKSCIKWSIAVGNRELGDSKLHTRLAECLWDLPASHNEKKNVSYHFAAGESPQLLCQKIFETYSAANEQETRSQQLCLGVVNFLALENLRDANELFIQYKKAEQKEHGNTVKDLNSLPLVVFCDYVLQTCRRDAAPLFKTLVNSYAGDLDFDEAVPTLLMGPIAGRFFGIKPKVNPMMSMLQSMMS
jgi:hypothetical protein